MTNAVMPIRVLRPFRRATQPTTHTTHNPRECTRDTAPRVLEHDEYFSNIELAERPGHLRTFATTFSRRHSSRALVCACHRGCLNVTLAESITAAARSASVPRRWAIPHNRRIPGKSQRFVSHQMFSM